MNSSHIKNYIDIIAVSLTILGSFGIAILDNWIVKVIVGVLLAVIIAASILYKQIKQRKQEKLLSNVGLTKEANKVCKKIDKLFTANIKNLNKMNNVSEKVSEDEQIQKIYTDKINGVVSVPKKSASERKQELLQLCEYMTTTIFDMDRILLLSEQYDYRIKFGKYIAQYSHNDTQVQKAYIDFLGWTYVIMGKNKQASEYINKGIECIKEYLQYNPELEDKAKFDAKLKLIRAYRHLGSNYNVYQKAPHECLKYLYLGMEGMKEQALIDYYKEHDYTKYVEMEVGLQYGIAICNLYSYKTKSKGYVDKKQLSSYLQRAIELVNKYKPMAKEFKNKHRYVKFVLLENSIYEELVKLSDEFEVKENVNNINFNGNIAEVETFLNTSLYSDEAMIYYLEQKLDSIYDQVNKIIK